MVDWNEQAHGKYRKLGNLCRESLPENCERCQWKHGCTIESSDERPCPLLAIYDLAHEAHEIETGENEEG
jgi:hypothetical protein